MAGQKFANTIAEAAYNITNTLSAKQDYIVIDKDQPKESVRKVAKYLDMGYKIAHIIDFFDGISMVIFTI